LALAVHTFVYCTNITIITSGVAWKVDTFAKGGTAGVYGTRVIIITFGVVAREYTKSCGRVASIVCTRDLVLTDLKRLEKYASKSPI
jgi:hypothetical protein